MNGQNPNHPIYLQQITSELQDTPILTSLNMGKKSRSPKGRNLSLKGLDESDLIKKIEEEVHDCKEDLNNLRLFNKSIVGASALKIDYKDKEGKYSTLAVKVNELENAEPSKENLKELRRISDDLELEIATLEAIFPQIIYKGVYMRKLAGNIVNNIGYQDHKEDAQVAFASLVSIEPHLHLDKINDENGKTSLQAAMRTISLLNEMGKFKNSIEDIAAEDKKLQASTKNRVIAGMGGTLLVMVILIALMSYMDDGWKHVKSVLVLGVPLGVLIWSFVGSFAAMLEQFYRKPVYEFGSTLKWIIVRPVVGVVMGAGIYLAFSTGFNISMANKEEGFMFFLAFLVGLSDSFTFGIIDKLKSSVISNVNIAGGQGVQVVNPQPQPMPTPIVVANPNPNPNPHNKPDNEQPIGKPPVDNDLDENE